MSNAAAIAMSPEAVFRARGLTKVYRMGDVKVHVGTTVIAALVGSLSAVQRVVALPPAEGMRGEAPLRFGRGLLDRTKLIRAVSPPVRMIFRSLQRTPLRTLMSLLAMATAGAILVVGQFAFDALESMIDVQFRAAQTDDATIALNEVRGDEAVHAIARLPGVIRVEPLRVVPVRIRSGHHSRRIALIGLERDATMRRLIDDDGHEVFLSPRGVVLTTKLAQILDVSAGDDVVTEALVAPRSVAPMRVTTLVDETIGISAYASRQEVNRFLREAMLASVRKTIVENIYISASMIVGFACVIAFGVIYLEAARTAESMAAKEQEAARFRAEATAYEVAVAKAALGLDAAEIVVRSPVHGRALQVLRESERVVAAGTPLIIVGDPSSLEIVADFLSTDAVRIRPGAPVRIERWGGAQALTARVRLVEPAAFTKVSALGVEEQRVNVICDLAGLADGAAPALGDQYRVDVRVVLWSGTATKVPATALFTTADQWNVFVLRGDRARLQRVGTGQMSETEVEITAGLRQNEAILVHPSDQIHDGARVSARR